MLLPIYNQKGISLVELLITLLLSLFMLTGVVQIFSSNSHSYRFSKAFSSLQENGRVALDEIARDIRMAGYLGCASRQVLAWSILRIQIVPPPCLGRRAREGGRCFQCVEEADGS